MKTHFHMKALVKILLRSHFEKEVQDNSEMAYYLAVGDCNGGLADAFNSDIFHETDHQL